MADTDSTFWQKRVIEHWDRINRLAARRFPDPNVADEAALFVLEAIRADDWRRVRTYAGRARFSTFLTVMVGRLLEDFSRSKYGRFRVPTWVRRLGPLWEQVFRLLCEERRSRDEVLAVLAGAGPDDRPETAVEECIGVILAETPDCGRRRMEAVAMDPADIEAETDGSWGEPAATPEALASARQQAELLEAVGSLLHGGDPRQDAGMAHGLAAVVGNRAALGDEDRLLLRMVYQDGLTVSAAGRRLGWEVDVTHRRLRQVLRRLRQAMTDAGLEKPLREILESPPEN